MANTALRHRRRSGPSFYLEPAATLDVDVFVTFNSDAGSPLISPEPIFDYLKERGCNMEGEYVMIAGWPVQFLPPTSPLVEEALEQAVEKDVEGSIARVFTAEHLKRHGAADGFYGI